ncbi:hypothetical protein PRUPE_5G085500 [Prunus persica]|uniref:Inhibitor I9 domain-containing protein n=1 Tax=Prunus persica TaxID=3760 RepID=A0A251P5M6_PRUPE|nr:hypothetical protein PRUPE_5G085500 [Prunus persica]
MFYLSLAVAQEEKNNLQTYIVWVQRPVSQNSFAQSHEDLESWYQLFLPETSANSNQLMTQRLVHTYYNVAIGFAAKLTPEEVKEMGKKEGFVSAHPERILPLLTIHSPDFLGLGLWEQTNHGEGVIIGVLDNGVAPYHPSFSDEGVSPHLAKRKGKCDFNETFSAAGNFVEGASAFGVANGTAVGMAPYAHLAIYRVCGLDCAEGDVLDAMDAAVHDGVDMLSLSLGWPSIPFYEDVIAGIFVICSAGNSGHEHGTLSNEAPWILTVGASTTDRILNLTSTPTATNLFNGSTSDPLAPKVATFSSRGPKPWNS